MTPRNLSIHRYFLGLAQRHQPRYRFSGESVEQWERWRTAFLPKLKRTLGRMPVKVDLNPQVQAEWHEDGMIKQRILLDVEEGLTASSIVSRPADAPGPLPAILTCHGHGRFGKEPVMGNRSTPDLRSVIEQCNYDYGLQMAKAGFVTMAIDWRGFGDRDDSRKSEGSDIQRGRDLCNLHYLRASILGMTVLGMDVHDGMCAIDYLCQQPFVNSDAIGVMGLSFGGTMSVWLAICDERIKAADIICYSDRFSDFAMRDMNFCGSQVTPGLYDLCDVPDLQGLIAPRPQLIEVGRYDECFHLDSAMSCFREVENIYNAAGVRNRLELDLFEGGHAWGGNLSVAFFRRWLR